MTLNVTEEEANLFDLHPGVTYNITVGAFNEEGEGFRSNPLSVRTREEGDFIFCVIIKFLSICSLSFQNHLGIHRILLPTL